MLRYMIEQTPEGDILLEYPGRGWYRAELAVFQRVTPAGAVMRMVEVHDGEPADVILRDWDLFQSTDSLNTTVLRIMAASFLSRDSLDRFAGYTADTVDKWTLDIVERAKSAPIY